MANDFTVTIDISEAPDRVWNLVGDPRRVAEWFTILTACTVDGNERRVTTPRGEIVETLGKRSDPERFYEYSVISGGAPMHSHVARMSVEEVPGGCRVSWRQNGSPIDADVDLEARLGGVMLAGLETLKVMFEGGA